MHTKTGVFWENQGRMIYFKRGKRTYSVAYRIISPTKPSNPDESPIGPFTLVYGASVHRKEHPGDNWEKRPHRHTAIGRCCCNPATVTVDSLKAYKLRKSFETILKKNGCEGGFNAEENNPTG